MGCGSYSYTSSVNRSRSLGASLKGIRTADALGMSDAAYSAATSSLSTNDYQKVFVQTRLDPMMDIKGKVRESCDSEEHPNSYPIIIGLDVTGSMARIPGQLLVDAFPHIMKELQDAGVEHAQICFVGIGDDVYDDAPIQVGQFETSDELTEKWLKKIYLEQGGGGNNGESYGLAWYFAARHTSIDSFKKRGVKGCLVTIGDEPILPKYSRHSVQELFGDEVQGDVKVSELIEETKEQWDVYHVKVDPGYTWGTERFDNWNKLLGEDHVIPAERNVNSIAKAITAAILNAYPKDAATESTSVTESEAAENSTTTIL